MIYCILRRDSMYTVYLHVNKINGKKYFGQTCQNVSDRWGNGSTYVNSIHFYRAIKKYGWDRFNHFIIKDNLTKEQADNLEKRLISKYETMTKGYNICVGGTGVMTERAHTEQAKDKIRLARAKQTFSDESQKKKAENMLGFKYDYIEVTFFDGNIRRYLLCSDIARELNMDKGHINKCLNGVSKTYIKCTFKYVFN